MDKRYFIISGIVYKGKKSFFSTKAISTNGSYPSSKTLDIMFGGDFHPYMIQEVSEKDYNDFCKDE